MREKSSLKEKKDAEIDLEGDKFEHHILYSKRKLLAVKIFMIT